MDIHQKLTNVFREIFGDPEIELTDKTTAEDIRMWDSTMHVVLIFSIEDSFGFKFSSKDLESLSNVGEMKAIISQKVTPP